MKKIHLLITITLVVGSLIFSSCSKEEAKLSPNIRPKQIDAILKNAPKRDMTNITSHLKDLSSKKGDSKSRAISKYNRVERLDANATFVDEHDFWYDGSKLTDITLTNTVVWSDHTTMYTFDDYFTYNGNQIQYQDEYSYDTDSNEWHWDRYYFYQYNSDNTIQYIIDYKTDGSVNRFLYFTYRYVLGLAGAKIDKVYEYGSDWDQPVDVRTYRYNIRSQITSVTSDPAVLGTTRVESYTYNSDGTLATRTLGFDTFVNTYTTDYWYTTRYYNGTLANYFVYYMDLSGPGNFEPWDPKNVINLNYLYSMGF